MSMATGSVLGCWRYPVKSLQGLHVERLDVSGAGVEGDRTWAFVDAAGKIASAKRYSALLMAAADDRNLTLPDGRRIALEDPEVDEAVSAWLGRPVTLQRAQPGDVLTYEMTFDPPDDGAELFDIPAPEGTFLDLAPLHLTVRATLNHFQKARPDLDWDIRRFRPNLHVELDAAPFEEDRWMGHHLRVGDVELRVIQPTVRCAMPLRAQPGLQRQPETYIALTELNPAAPNHLGIYLEVRRPGRIHRGDNVEVHLP